MVIEVHVHYSPDPGLYEESNKNQNQIGETWARSVTFSQIYSGWHTFHTWRLILYQLVTCGKSFKWCIDGFSCISVISTLASIMCWYLTWQNLPHIWGWFCHLWGHSLPVVGHLLISPDATQRAPGGIKNVSFIVVINYIQDDSHMWSQYWFSQLSMHHDIF